MVRVMFKNLYEAIRVGSNKYKVIAQNADNKEPSVLYHKLYTLEQLGRMGFISKKISNG